MPSSNTWLLVGLGNPGSRYAGNRHNVGFMVVDDWIEAQTSGGVPPPTWQTKWHALTATCTASFGRVVVVKPQTYMNVSGKSVAAAATFHRILPEQIVVVHDELDFPFGRVAVKTGGGHGGHNGLRDIISMLGSREFIRIRVGIGRPEVGDVSPWVLSDFDEHDRAELPDVFATTRRAISHVFERGAKAAMNEFNRAPERES